jgi:hypothetical protein
MSGPLSILDYRQPVEFHIGDVFVKSWRVLTRHFVTFFLLVAIAEVPLLVANSGLQTSAPHVGRLSLSAALLALTALFLQLFLGVFAQSVVVFAAFQDLRGKEVTFGESFQHGLSRFLPVIALSFLVAIVLVLGLMLCLVPGLIALAALYVALPVCVVERVGPIRSMSRSTDLTTGHWWPILGVVVGIAIVTAIVNAAIRAALPAEPAIPIVAASWLWGVLSASFSAVFTAILYHDLRAVKEGIGIEQIAAVFD